MTDINDIMPENCKKLLLEKNRTGQRTYCTEKPEFFPKELQDEIEARLGEVSLVSVLFYNYIFYHIGT